MIVITVRKGSIEGERFSRKTAAQEASLPITASTVLNYRRLFSGSVLTDNEILDSLDVICAHGKTLSQVHHGRVPAAVEAYQAGNDTKRREEIDHTRDVMTSRDILKQLQ